MNQLNSFITKAALPLLLVATGILSACSKAPEATNPVAVHSDKIVEAPADAVFINAKIYTVNDSQPWAEALAIKDGKIVYVGDTASAKQHIDENTEVRDLEGKMVLPGFVSGHDHLVASNWTKAGVNLFPAKSKEETLQLIKEHADANPDDEFLYGYGWNYTTYGGRPTAAEMDAVTPNHKAILFDFTIHDAWLNSALMEAGGIDKNTKDKQPGFSYWERDADGNPTGNAIELAWFEAYINSGAWNPNVLVADSQKALYDIAASQGWTAVNNVGLVTPNISDEQKNNDEYDFAMDLLANLEQQGELKLRTNMHMMYKNGDIVPDGVIAQTLKLKKKYDSDMLRINSIKIHPEANWGTSTSLLLKGYEDQPDYNGIRGITAERVDEMIKKANAEGIDVSVHVDGSATVRATIDTILESRKTNPDERNSLQHFAVVHPDDQKRAGDNKIPVNITTLWRTDWGNSYELALNKLGEERAHDYFQMIGNMIDSGTTVSISADVPSTPSAEAGALFLLGSGMTGLNPGDPNSKPWPNKGGYISSLEEGLKTITIHPAWQIRMEDKIGSLEVGKYADLVVLEKNLFDIPADEIAGVKVLETIVGGKVTYRNDL